MNSFLHRLAVGAARMAANRKIKRYGHMTTLQIDSVGRVVRATLVLKGEKEPVEVEAGYAIETREGRTEIMLERVKVSREWMEALAADLLVNRPLELKGLAATLLTKVL